MAPTTLARGDTSGRMNRESPQAPRGRHPRRRTFWTRPIEPRRTVPATPTIPKAGLAGAVVPTPAACHPEKKWCQLADHPRSGASCPTIGREPKKSSRVPKATTIAATSPASARWRPVLRNDGAHLVPEPIATRTVAQIVQLVEVGVLAEGKADAPGQDGPLRTPAAAWPAPPRGTTALAASNP